MLNLSILSAKLKSHTHEQHSIESFYIIGRSCHIRHLQLILLIDNGQIKEKKMYFVVI